MIFHGIYNFNEISGKIDSFLLKKNGKYRAYQH